MRQDVQRQELLLNDVMISEAPWKKWAISFFDALNSPIFWGGILGEFCGKFLGIVFDAKPTVSDTWGIVLSLNKKTSPNSGQKIKCSKNDGEKQDTFFHG